MSEIRYCYALDSSNRIVHIKEAYEINGTYTCPCCQSEMIKKCGQQKAWHFAHKHKQCSYDKYLHTIAELRIKEWFNTSNHVDIELYHKLKCPQHDKCKWCKEYMDKYDEELEGYCYREIKKMHNLKQWFYRAELERTFFKNGKKFVADIFCHNKEKEDEPLFIEICVTHPCSPEKISSGIKIIEFNIVSEDYIDAIIESPQRECDLIHFYNFQPNEEIGKLQHFGKFLQKFVLMPSYKAFVNEVYCHEIDQRRGLFELSISHDGYFLGDGGFYAVAIAVSNTYFQYNSCVLCKYQAFNSWENTRICKLYKKCGTHKYIKDNNPIECPYYRRNEKAFQAKINAFNEYCKYNHVDIWVKQQ